MSRPTLEVADIVRAAGNRFWEHNGSHLAWQHRKVLDGIVRCRTAALGGHRDQCMRCGHQAISYNSCRNRHCPRCQGNARARWLAARAAELLPVPYFHIVFTLPHELSALILQNKRLLYDLLFRTSAATLLELAHDPKHLGAEIGFLGVLHTWGQNLQGGFGAPGTENLNRRRREPNLLRPAVPTCYLAPIASGYSTPKSQQDPQPSSLEGVNSSVSPLMYDWIAGRCWDTLLERTY